MKINDKKMLGAGKVSWLQDKIILNHTKKSGNIVYGAQSMKVQLGIFSRKTVDYDIYSKQPKKSAVQVTNQLNRVARSNDYYNVPSRFHKGTYKVYYVGVDGVPYTKDDRGVVDYTELKKGVKFVIINGVKYSVVDNTVRDKLKSLSDKKYEFRHEKDRADLERIQGYQKFKRIPVAGKILR